MEHPSIYIIFNIAATPKGVAIIAPIITVRGEEARYGTGTPKGVLLPGRVSERDSYCSLWYRPPKGVPLAGDTKK